MKFERVPETSWFDGNLAEHWVQFAVLCVIALGLLFAFWRVLRPRRQQSCRWKTHRLQRREGMKRWQCMNCGVDAYGSGRKPPKECKRALREVSL